MTPRDLRNFHTTGNKCKEALPCSNMALKLPWHFYLLMEKPLRRYFQVQSPYYQAAQCNQKTPILVSSRWQVRSEKAKNREALTLIIATTSIHLPKPVSTDLTIKPDSVLTNLVGKDGVRSWLMHTFTCCFSWSLGSSSKCGVLLFCRYYFGICSSELAQLVPLYFSRGLFTCYSDRLHDISISILDVTMMSLSTVSFIAQLDPGILCL